MKTKLGRRAMPSEDNPKSSTGHRRLLPGGGDLVDEAVVSRFPCVEITSAPHVLGDLLGGSAGGVGPTPPELSEEVLPLAGFRGGFPPGSRHPPPTPPAPRVPLSPLDTSPSRAKHPGLMRQIPEENRFPAYVDAQPPVRAAAALRPVIRGYRDEIEREQRLPKALVEQFHAAGFYSLVIPRELGGLQADPLTYLRVVELLAEAAGSVGWNLANNSIGQLVTLGLPDEGVREVYAHGPDTVIAGAADHGPRRRPPRQPVEALAGDLVRRARPGVGRAPPQLRDHRHRKGRHRRADRAGQREDATRPDGSALRRSTGPGRGGAGGHDSQCRSRLPQRDDHRSVEHRRGRPDHHPPATNPFPA